MIPILKSLVVVPLLCAAVLAQQPADAPAAAAPPGSMLSDGMVRALIKRYAYEMGRQLELDDDQQAEFTDTVLQRWMPFVERHRRELAPLVDRMAQAAWDPDLPTAEEAETWGRQALNMHDLILQEWQRGNEEVGKILTPRQAEQFNKQTMRINAGMAWFRLELAKMANGQLHDTAWAKNRLQRQERRDRRAAERREQRRHEEVLRSQELTLVTLDVWTVYVTRFVKQFSLDEAQKRAAQTILEDIRQRARNHVRAHEDDLRSVRRQLEAAKQQQRADILDGRAELVQPLRDLFGELQSRLEALPTEAQRKAATDSEVKSLQ